MEQPKKLLNCKNCEEQADIPEIEEDIGSLEPKRPLKACIFQHGPCLGENI